MGERRGACRVFVGKFEVRRPLGRPRRSGSIILKWILEKWVGRSWTGSILLRMGAGRWLS